MRNLRLTLLILFILNFSQGVSADDHLREINELIESIEQSNSVFIRNGEEYQAEEAAQHLRRKWENAGDRITSAEQFIRYVASKSSLSGEPYRIRDQNHRETLAKEWLEAELAKIRATSP